MTTRWITTEEAVAAGIGSKDMINRWARDRHTISRQGHKADGSACYFHDEESLRYFKKVRPRQGQKPTAIGVLTSEVIHEELDFYQNICGYTYLRTLERLADAYDLTLGTVQGYISQANRAGVAA